jgi:RNA polymerase sigma factor (sigma-70 family)
MEDAELVARARNGRRDAFEALVGRYSRLVAGVAAARLGRPSELEDVMQETFTRAWANLSRLRDPSRFSSWLYGIAKWVCSEKAHDRDRDRDRDRHHASMNGESVAVPCAPEASERKEIVLQAVEALPEPYRETLLLFYFEESSYEELARALGVTKAAINFRLTRARAMLRQKLSAVSRGTA